MGIAFIELSKRVVEALSFKQFVKRNYIIDYLFFVSFSGYYFFPYHLRFYLLLVLQGCCIFCFWIHRHKTMPCVLSFFGIVLFVGAPHKVKTKPSRLFNDDRQEYVQT